MSLVRIPTHTGLEPFEKMALWGICKRRWERARYWEGLHSICSNEKWAKVIHWWPLTFEGGFAYLQRIEVALHKFWLRCGLFLRTTKIKTEWVFRDWWEPDQSFWDWWRQSAGLLLRGLNRLIQWLICEGASGTYLWVNDLRSRGNLLWRRAGVVLMTSGLSECNNL